jgi:hypothetical protein
VREPSYRDRKGNERIIGQDQYLNRIFSYLEQNARNGTLLSMVESEMNYIFSKADNLSEKSKINAGGITKEDVELAIIHMYLVIAEIAKIGKVDTIYLNTIATKNF